MNPFVLKGFFCFNTILKFNFTQVIKSSFFLVVWLIAFPNLVFCQLDKTHIELRIKNDDAGEISNWLNSGDDVGETQSMYLAFHWLTKHPKYNYRFELESTEFSKFNETTSEKRDIFFTEVNTLQLGADNYKLKNKQHFYGVRTGLHFIQGNRLTIGASGQKYYWHQLVLSNFYNNKNWIYTPNGKRDVFVTFIKFIYGYHLEFFKSEKINFYSAPSSEAILASNHHFSGLGLKPNLNVIIKNTRYNMHSVGLDAEFYYQSNFTNYQIMYLQVAMQAYFKSVSFYVKLNKPFKKHLLNPFIVYNDLEFLFNYGLTVSFK